MKRLTIIAAVLSLTLGTAAAPVVQPAMSSVPGGIAVGSSDPWDANRAENYRKMADAGSTYVRGDIPWEYLQPDSATQPFDWGLYDSQIADVAASGQHFVAILHMTPRWANGGRGSYAPPSDLGLLRSYCYRVAQRYIPRGVLHYEIGNEVNLPHPGAPSPSGGDYVRSLLTPCSAGVRQAARESAPSRRSGATVLLGALAPSGVAATEPALFLAAVYRAGGGGMFSALSLHPYTFEPLTHPNMTETPGELDSITRRYVGVSRRIWATEFGAPTGGDVSVTETRQAELITEAFSVWSSYPWAGPMLIYSDRDLDSGSTERENRFGMLRSDGSNKPSYQAFRTAMGR